MKVVSLISGGKDSTFNMVKCVQDGHEIVCLANLEPHEHVDTDSYMYQTVGSECIGAIASVMGLPLVRRIIKGKPIAVDADYVQTEGDEVNDLYVLLEACLKLYPDIEAVSVGAIASTYQKTRVEDVCSRLNLKPLCYLWGVDQAELLSDMFASGLESIVIKVASLGLKVSDLGMNLRRVQPRLLDLHTKYGTNVAGEGGEYETFVINCPQLYRESLQVVESRTVVVNDEPGPVAYIQIKLATPTTAPAIITYVDS